MWKAKDITSKRLGNIVEATIRKYTGRGKLYGLAEVARLSSLSTGTIESILRGCAGLRLDTALKLATVPKLGFTLLSKLLAPLGYQPVPMGEGDLCYRRTQSKFIEAVHTLDKALQDGHVDHLEEPDILALYEEIFQYTGMRLTEKGRL